MLDLTFATLVLITVLLLLVQVQTLHVSENQFLCYVGKLPDTYHSHKVLYQFSREKHLVKNLSFASEMLSTFGHSIVLVVLKHLLDMHPNKSYSHHSCLLLGYQGQTEYSLSLPLSKQMIHISP